MLRVLIPAHIPYIEGEGHCAALFEEAVSFWGDARLPLLRAGPVHAVLECEVGLRDRALYAESLQDGIELFSLRRLLAEREEGISEEVADLGAALHFLGEAIRAVLVSHEALDGRDEIRIIPIRR